MEQGEEDGENFIIRVEADPNSQDKKCIYIPHPPPQRITCGLGCGSGSYASKTKVANMHKHLKDKHNIDAVIYYSCLSCDELTNTVVSANQHQKSCLHNEPAEVAAEDKAEIVSGPDQYHTITLPAPIRPTQCPKCNWVTFATKGAGELSTSLSHHLFRRHGIQSKWRWKCSDCNNIITSYHISAHKCPVANNSTLSEEPNLSISLTPDLTRDRRRSVNLEFFASIRQRLEATSPANWSINEPPVAEPNQSTSIITPESESQVDADSSAGESVLESPVGQQQPQVLSGDPASGESFFDEPSTQVETDENLSPSPNQATVFCEKWKPQFLACSELQALECLLDRLTEDWHATLAIRAEPTPAAREQRPATKEAPLRRERHQNRQQQRAKQKQKKKDPKQASRIQKKFILRPRQAVREVLGETSLPYSGTIEEAKAHLNDVFQRPAPSEKELEASRKLFDDCEWAEPSEEQASNLAGPPTKEEVARKLHRAVNTSPGMDRIEYRHIKSLDPTGTLLATLYAAVWRLGIPRQWKTDKTVSIYKKGDPSQLVNFRPIALLSTLYKLFSSVLSSRLMAVSTKNGWLSPEQKGFLPAVRGIQEHTHLLQSAIDEAKRAKRNLSICWLDLSNAFGSIPHATLAELFNSLPIPDELRKILKDIYTGTTSQFLIGKEAITIALLAGVRQGDSLSTIVFDLAIEPLVRAAKSETNPGFDLLGLLLKATAYADDIALVTNSLGSLQRVLHLISIVAAVLGFRFKPEKCAQLSLLSGKANTTSSVTLYDNALRAISEGEHEIYLGIPIGCKLMFRLEEDFRPLLIKLSDSLLAPWQKLEVFRAYLLPSLSHQLSSGRVKNAFDDLEADCRTFLRSVSNSTLNANNAFLYADRRVGGLGAMQTSDEAKIWTLARATQLLDSSDPVVRGTSREQLRRNVIAALGLPHDAQDVPVSAYLSGSQDGALAIVKHISGRQDFWSRARSNAIWFKDLQIDISSSSTPTILVADEVSVVSAKAVRGLRTVVRQRWTNRFLQHSQQGRVAQGLALDTKSKDIAWMTSWRTGLTFQDWHQLHRARLCLLPVRARPGCGLANKKCRHCNRFNETTAHVVSACQNSMVLATERHDAVQNLLVGLLRRYGHSVEVNKQFAGSVLRPDIVITSTEQPILIDVTVTWDDPASLSRAQQEKISKYQQLGQILPFVVGALGSWPPETQEIQQTLQIHPRDWNYLRRRARLAAIQGTTKIINHHLNYTDEHEPDDPDAIEEPLSH